MANNTISILLTEEQIQQLEQTWKDAIQEKKPQYARFQMRLSDCVITCYESGKTVFQGLDAEIYASPFQAKDHLIFPQAGSDEVGTGDYFGPVCVCAVVINEKDQALLKKEMVQDSKQLTDEQIWKIAPHLKKHLKHSLLVVPPKKYNVVHHTNNLNKIKALLHNQAYVNLQKKEPLPEFCVVDQFTPKRQYYSYIKDETNIVSHLHFETKAENKYPSVGAASILARYAFLEYMQKMEEEYQMSFQKGAGTLVDQCALEFINRYGFERLHEVAKLHFKNTTKVKELLQL